MYKNEMILKFKAINENEAFARVCISAFIVSMDPTIDEIGDIKTAVSEAVTNCVVHAYDEKVIGDIEMKAVIEDNNIYISIRDFGVGIEDIDKAKEPFFTSKPSKERSGMGFTVMESFMDSVNITSQKDHGTLIEMYKTIGKTVNIACGV